MTRTYELKQRARRQEETRQRIVDATVALHGSVGPAHTTISAIAQRAGVQRLTVYRHFPDERALFRACRDDWVADNPAPDVSAWAAIDDPAQRLSTALGELYAYFRATEPMTANVLRDLPESAALREAAAPFLQYWDAVRIALEQGWNLQGRRRARLRAVIGHAIEFDTWRSLARTQGLDDGEAAALMVRLARAV
jgi:AcrR family transcriptional regulator